MRPAGKMYYLDSKARISQEIISIISELATVEEPHKSIWMRRDDWDKLIQEFFYSNASLRPYKGRTNDVGSFYGSTVYIVGGLPKRHIIIGDATEEEDNESG